MKLLIAIALFSILSVSLLIAPAFADALTDALATYQAGNFGAAKQMLTPLAEAGNATAQDTLYHLYWFGKGTPTDFREGLKWAQASAASGNADAEHGIAMAYSFGLGVARDPVEGVKWLRKAADDGSSKADIWLARMYLYGEGVVKDEPRGLEYLAAAADKGLARAQVAMGTISELGHYGRPKDIAAGVRWETMAAEQRFYSAQISLSAAYGGGFGVEKDAVESAMWFILASSTGCDRGREPPFMVFPNAISERDLGKARVLATYWDKVHPPLDINQYDSGLDPCWVNNSEPLPSFDPISGSMAIEQDKSGKGPVLCIWRIFVATEGTISACGLPRDRIDDVIDAGISRMDKFIIKNASHPITQELLDDQKRWLSGIGANTAQQIDQSPELCTNPDIQRYRKITPEQLKRGIDDMLSVPREPLMNPCF